MDSVNTYENLKDAILSQVGESNVAEADEFQMGFFRKSEKLWIETGAGSYIDLSIHYLHYRQYK